MRGYRLHMMYAFGLLAARLKLEDGRVNVLHLQKTRERLLWSGKYCANRTGKKSRAKKLEQCDKFQANDFEGEDICMSLPNVA